MGVPEATIITSVITALVTILTVIINSRTTENKIMAEMKINQAVTDEKIRTLTEEVARHNSFGSQIPVILNRLDTIEKKINN